MNRYLPVDELAYEAAIERARRITVLAGIVVAIPLLNLLPFFAMEQGPLRRQGAMHFLVAGVVIIVASLVVRKVWQRTIKLRPLLQDLDEFGHVGIKGLSPEPKQHISLGDDPVTPPTRW